MRFDSVPRRLELDDVAEIVMLSTRDDRKAHG
jgi:hypothetical protein